VVTSGVAVRCPAGSSTSSRYNFTASARSATAQVGTGRTVSEVAAELACDWHTVNDAVTAYGQALLAADRKRAEPHQRHRPG
jgi:transposase